MLSNVIAGSPTKGPNRYKSPMGCKAAYLTSYGRSSVRISAWFFSFFFFCIFLPDMLVIKTDKASCIEMFNLCLVSTMKTKMEV